MQKQHVLHSRHPSEHLIEPDGTDATLTIMLKCLSAWRCTDCGIYPWGCPVHVIMLELGKFLRAKSDAMALYKLAYLKLGTAHWSPTLACKTCFNPPRCGDGKRHDAPAQFKASKTKAVQIQNVSSLRQCFLSFSCPSAVKPHSVPS